MDKEHLKEQLRKEMQALLEVRKSGRESASTVELDQSRVGRLSRMDALQSQAMLQEADRRREVKISNIEAALQRLASGNYGYCESCGELIASKRLEFNPSVRFCIECADTSA